MPETRKETCPECGVDMSGRDARGHAISHWGDKLKERVKENPEIGNRLRKMGVEY